MTFIIPKVWTDAKRDKMQRKLNQEAAKLAKSLGAHCATITVFWPDEDYIHMQTGGQSPYPFSELFSRLAEMFTKSEEEESKAKTPSKILRN